MKKEEEFVEADVTEDLELAAEDAEAITGGPTGHPWQTGGPGLAHPPDPC